VKHGALAFQWEKEPVMKLAKLVLVFGIGLVLVSGCASTSHNGHGILYGCDGSGAGVVIRWGRSANKGVRDGGYKGVIQSYRWQTGMGAVVDHMSGQNYKRRIAKGLAKRIVDHRTRYPDDPIYVAGLSAGSVVVLYALEELPPNVAVDQVLLLSSSVSADYDLSKALHHVHGRLYAFTSSKDAVLNRLVTTVGTADGRAVGTDISGLRGFRAPSSAKTEVQELYRSKVRNIPWRQEFAQYGHRGGHTDVMASPFVARYVAPLLVVAPGGAR